LKFLFIPATEMDESYFLALRKLTMTEHLQCAGRYLDDEQHRQRVKLDYDCSHKIVYQNCTIGMLKFRQSQQEVEIMQFQIHPDHQGQGLGKKVLEQVLKGAKVARLSVLKGNPAIHLYQRLGFEVIDEDAEEFYLRFAP
jgi:ribosomal protein S18 acetylase RimI-like enzyme